MVVLPEPTVAYWSELMVVLGCRTWGDLRSHLSPEVYREVLELAGYGQFAAYAAHLAITGTAPLPGVEEEVRRQYEDVPDNPPDHDSPFDAYSDLPAVADGDWPADPAS